ncbi:hypothetical protein [Shewanella sedimentimangrovi]|uniref:Cardiolipin synthase N-terminal domain-containing protein n=1 Tax=Shewanella sedimentimangrovi TaxID=2814293 RepID=A0ABX7R4R7_9GAMM|nr:hypothetical protein [Shewanella sedimentimangrovi]QSX38272.1 hypothetical protein JYB85_05445 [Shewanella sedimentimangrovi]
MNLNATLVGQIAFVLAIIVIYFTLRFAKRGAAENLPLVGFYALLLNFILPPAGWIYCWYWSRKAKQRRMA